jgi:hypothetical protein
MATIQIIYWHEFPSQVQGRDENGLVRVDLPERFSKVINSAAIAAGKSEEDAYMMGWRRGRRKDHPGSAQEAAQAVADQLADEFPMERLREMSKARRHAATD